MDGILAHGEAEVLGLELHLAQRASPRRRPEGVLVWLGGGGLLMEQHARAPVAAVSARRFGGRRRGAAGRCRSRRIGGARPAARRGRDEARGGQQAARLVEQQAARLVE